MRHYYFVRRWRPLLTLLFATALLHPAIAQTQSVGIGTTAPNAKAALEITASDKGLLIPRLDSVQRVAIASPPQGLLVYQKNGRAGLWYYQSGAWQFLQPNLANLSAGNGLTRTGNQVQLGGTLSGATTVAQGTNPLGFTGTGGVGIGTATPAASAQLDVTSTTKGFLPPRMTQTERNAIGAPAAGLTIYTTTTNKLNTWNGTAWTEALTTTETGSAVAPTTYSTAGTYSYTVPSGVATLTVDARGAKGGDDFSTVQGGNGARVQATLAVTPGEVLTINVGGLGTTAPAGAGGGGFNGGGNGTANNGGGGGATDIRRGGTGLADRILVAAGGGGASSFGVGGTGGGPNGGNGAGTQPGQGATQAASGTGWAGVGNGTLGQGGQGTWTGGGGGYYGGGGGANGGGGGGASWVTPTSSSAIAYTAGTNAAGGTITLTPGLSYAAPALLGTNIINVPGTWSVSGSDVYRGSGNVGIGTASPTVRLHVAGTAGTPNVRLESLAGTGTRLVTVDASGQLVSASALPAGVTGDNLGSHTATQNLNLGTSQLVGNGGTSGVAISSSGSVGIGTTTPAATAQLDVSSTTKGFLPPRLTQAQRDGISSPATGLVIYNTDTNRLNIWNGTTWTDAVNTPLPATSLTAAVTFAYTGAVQTYTVPAGVTSIQVTAAGAQGGTYSSTSSIGGKGALATATLAVSPGEVLWVYVGGAGGFRYSQGAFLPGGWNGGGAVPVSFMGGAGGGASDIRQGGTALANRVVVAGGGGGAIAGFTSYGGAGGAAYGGTGSGSGGGTGGSQAGGGSVGGTLGLGGDSGSNTCGAGGGGYYGGGSGTNNDGGGGGGSSWISPAAWNATMTAASQSGDGVVTITPVPTLQTTGAVSGSNVQFPQLTQVQIDAMTAPLAGTLVYNLTTGQLNYYTGYGWIPFASATDNPVQPFNARTYYYTGAVQTYTVPAGVTAVDLDARGAQGGSNLTGNRIGGNGARVQARLTVTPGQVLSLYVGSAGTTAPSGGGGAGYNGGGNGGATGGARGGGGGGATDVRAGGTALANRVLVAAGGGGGGGSANLGGNGGAGGAPTGANGLGTAGTTPGTGATQATGGSLGGALGQGGTAGAGFEGGGGGGGYYGGGGATNIAGGGGGSSWVTPTGSSGISYTAGVQAGDGQLTITPVGPLAAPLILANNLTGTIPTTTLGLTPETGGIVFTNANALRQKSSDLFWDNTNNRLGLGTNAPTQRLDVSGNATISGSATVAGSMGIGTTTPAQSLDVAGSATVSGAVGVGTSSPQTALDVAGALTLRNDGTITVLTADNQLVTVGNRTFIRLSSNSGTATSRTVVLSDGLQIGQLLIIENAGTTGAFAIGDTPAVTNADTNGQRALGYRDLVTLIWNGDDWLELSFSAN